MPVGQCVRAPRELPPQEKLKAHSSALSVKMIVAGHYWGPWTRRQAQGAGAGRGKSIPPHPSGSTELSPQCMRAYIACGILTMGREPPADETMESKLLPVNCQVLNNEIPLTCMLAEPKRSRPFCRHVLAMARAGTGLEGEVRKV